MLRHRLRFSKTGRAIYLSHLDLMRTMQRVFLRAGVRIRHTEGFTPHAYISVALPLSVGVESVCEILDFECTDDTPLDGLPARLTEMLPEGLAVTAAYEAQRRPKEIAWLALTGTLDYDGGADMGRVAEALTAFYGKEEIVIQKRTKKKKLEDVDIAPMIHTLRFSPGAGGVALEATLAAQNPGLNPERLLDALRQLQPELAPDFAAFRRVEVYDAAMTPFR